MWPKRNYLDDAKEHERVFRNILRSLGIDEKELSLEDVYKEYSEGNRYGMWTILDFRRGPFDGLGSKLSEDEALFASQDVATLSGQGSVARYKIAQDDSVEFDSNISVWIS